MNETWNRWQARIGSLKPAAIFVVLLAGVFLIVAASNTMTALRNPKAPDPIAVRQLVDGTVGTGQWVSVSGYATLYDAYTLEEDGKQTATYFFLLDENTGHSVVVKAKTATTYGRQPGQVAFSGMTRSTPSDLERLIKEDIPDIENAGFVTTSSLYVHEEAKPPDLVTSFLGVLVLGAIVLASLVIMAFPTTVFRPHPLQLSIPSQLPQQRPATKATGQLQQLKSVKPLQVGKKTRKFTNGVANIVPLAERKLMIYIHHILRTKTYGITVSKQETDWGAFVTGENVISVETGKLYGWKDRPALQFQYQGPRGKPETLVLSFETAEDQVNAVAILQRIGFAIDAQPAAF